MLGVRYYMAWTPEAQAKADAHPDLTQVASIPDRDGVDPKGWKIYEVEGSELVAGIAVRAGGRADARGHDVVVLRPARARPTAPATRSSACGSAPRRAGSRTTRSSTRRGPSRVPRSGRASTSTISPTSPRTRARPGRGHRHRRGRRQDLVPRRRGRRAGRGEGVVLPELGGARRRGSVSPRAEHDGRRSRPRTTSRLTYGLTPRRLARPRHHARRARSVSSVSSLWKGARRYGAELDDPGAAARRPARRARRVARRTARARGRDRRGTGPRLPQRPEPAPALP